MGSTLSLRTALLVALAAALSAASLVAGAQRLAVAVPPSDDFWVESVSASERTAGAAEPQPQPDSQVPAVFRNGAWTPDYSTSLNAYVAVLLSKDVYFKHVIDPRDTPAARRNFTLFARAFCRSMFRLGADDCEVISGATSLVWAVVRAGPSVLLVVRGSNSPQNWITDVTSLRMVNVEDFGGGARGTNVALGFYKVFASNRRVMVDRVHAAMAVAEAAAAESAAAAADGDGDGDGAHAGRGSRARLWVSGHSLGGAVGLMAASYLNIHEGLAVTGVYTFGCPRAGDESWARSYQLHDVTLRLENAGDVIPALPFGAGWRHVGSAAAIQACRSLLLPPAAAAVATPTLAELAAAAAASGGDGAAESVPTSSRAFSGLQQRRRLRGIDNGAVSSAAAEGASVAFPFPVPFRDHWVQTYARVMWSCLPEGDSDLVPGPEDVYDAGDV